jgi:chorismate mutase
MGQELDNFRLQINRIDDELVDLLAQRLGICREVADFKKANNIPMMQPARVEIVKQRCAERGMGRGLAPDFVRGIYELVIGEACRIEDEIIDHKGEASRIA